MDNDRSGVKHKPIKRNIGTLFLNQVMVIVIPIKRTILDENRMDNVDNKAKCDNAIKDIDAKAADIKNKSDPNDYEIKNEFD